MPESTKKSTPVKIKCEDGRGGAGYLVVGGPMISGTGMRIKAALGTCPKCETPADPWEPPVGLLRYQQRIASIREGYKLESDAAAHKAYLQETGGYIEICSNCGNSFFVPSSVAKIKEKDDGR